MDSGCNLALDGPEDGVAALCNFWPQQLVPPTSLLQYCPGSAVGWMLDLIPGKKIKEKNTQKR